MSDRCIKFYLEYNWGGIYGSVEHIFSDYDSQDLIEEFCDDCFNSLLDFIIGIRQGIEDV